MFNRIKILYHTLVFRIGIDPRWHFVKIVSHLMRLMSIRERRHKLAPPASELKRILVICKFGIGNSICLTPLLKNLRTLAPQAEVHFAASPIVLSLLDGSGLFDVGLRYPWQFSGAGQLLKTPLVLRKLARAKYDVCIVGYPDDAEDVEVVRSFVDLGFTVGVDIERGVCPYDAYLPMDESLHEVNMNLRLLDLLGAGYRQIYPDIGLRRDEMDWAEQVLKGFAGMDDLRIGMHCGAAMGHTYKMWPLSRYEELIMKLNRELNVKIILFGGLEEKRLMKSLSERCDKCLIDMSGQYAIRQSAALISCCDLMVGGDTGPMHIASAVKVPSVVIFGPTNAIRSCPFGPDSNVRIVSLNRSCSPCSTIRSPFQGCDDEMRCLMDLTSDEVWRMIRQMLPQSVAHAQRRGSVGERAGRARYGA